MLLILLSAFGMNLAEAAPKKAAPKAAYTANKSFKKAIEKNHREFDRCGQAERARTKRAVKGVVLIRFIVSGDGKVTESGPVHNTTKSRFIADCLVRAIEQVKFPPSFGAPVTGSYPFKFNIKK